MSSDVVVSTRGDESCAVSVMVTKVLSVDRLISSTADMVQSSRSAATSKHSKNGSIADESAWNRSSPFVLMAIEDASLSA